ncbi:MAG: universal stress protein [Planctomycetaceae bacterium]
MLPRFRHILVPIDSTARSSAAVDIAFELAVQNNATTSLLHVVQSIDSGGDSPDEETTEFYDHIRERAESEMERMSQRFLDANIACEVKVRIGDRLHEIVEFAGQHQVDLIVMSSHRIDPNHLAETWGTLSYKVSVICECPILLVK